MSKKDDVSIFMPIFWADYMKDTEDLEFAEHGAYMMLIRAYWNNQGPLESNLGRIYRRCKAMTESDKAIIDKIVGKFFSESEGKLYHKRIDSELKKSRKIKRVRAEAGRQSGLARRTKAEQMFEQNHEQNGNPSTSYSPSPTLDENKEKKESKPDIKKSNISSSNPVRDDSIPKNFRFDILVFLSDKELSQAKKIKPDWDFYDCLVPTFNKWITTTIKKPPDRPAAAFQKWIKSYTKNQQT